MTEYQASRMPPRPTMLSQGQVIKALADPKFFELMPEFKSLQVKMATMHAPLKPIQPVSRGCGSCKKSRVSRNLYSEFLTLTTAISPDGLTRLKGYLGVPQLLLHVLNREGRAEVRVL